MMRRWIKCSLWIGALLVVPVVGWTYYQQDRPGLQMTEAAQAWVASLNAQQKQTALLPYDTPQRVGWHFIPKDERKGLQVKHMTTPQREAAHKLLQAALSQVGYEKAKQIMELESLLLELEGPRDTIIRDPERYYFTLFGEPEASGRWGLSVEGHHLSLNFVVEDGTVIGSTPQFFGANPATVKTENTTGIPIQTRVLAKEEQLAFDLVNALDAQQRKTAIIDERAPREIRAAGEPQPPTDAPVGIPFTELNDDQRRLLRDLVFEYVNAVPPPVAQGRRDAIREAGVDGVHFAWAGAIQPGIGHYYRVQGETFLIEFVNTQPDAAGNPANHIHAVWRDMHGDFAIPIGQ